MTDDFVSTLMEMAKQIEPRGPAMLLKVSKEGKSVELILDSKVPFYSDWIKGEGGDICLYREQETNRVVGCHLPLMQETLCVFHEGPLEISGQPPTDTEDS